MKRVASFAIMLAMLLGLLPAANAAGKEPIQAADLDVTWYSDWDVLSRLYGTDRMILVKDNLCALYGLDGTKYTDPVFDAIGEYDAQGHAAAMKNGKWGKIDRNGGTVIDFVYDTQEEARDEVGVRFVSKRPEEPPYALAKLDGTLLTGYDFWAWRPFFNGFSFVTDGTDGWGFIDTAGRAVTEQKYIGLIMNDAKMGGGDFSEDGYAIVYYKIGYDSVYNIINAEGQELLSEPIGTKPWRAGLGLWGYVDNETGKVGFCDGTGAVVITPQFEYRVTPKGFMRGNWFDETTGVAEVYKGNETIFIDAWGNQVEEGGVPDWKRDLHEGLAWVNAQGNDVGFGYNYGIPWGFRNEAGELVVPCIYDTVGHFDHGYAAVTVDGVYGLLKNPLNKRTEEPEENKPEVPAPTFTDVPAGSWFEEGVMTCAQNGIMVGTGEDTFSPNATLTDAETLMLGYRLYDQTNGGDGSLLKMPEDYGYIRIISDDGSFVHEGYAGDRSLWEVPNIHYSAEGYRLCLRGYGEYTGGASGEATLTFGGKEYRGTLEHMYRGSGRYEQDNFFGFEPEDPTLNHLMFDVCYHTAPPTQWWADLLYTIDQKGWKNIFSGFLLLFGNEDYRGGFADLLGTVTDLPKKFNVPSIPDGGNDHLYKLYEAGIVGGVDPYGTFDSAKTLTRAEAAVMVARILDESQRLTAPPKPMPKEGEGYTLTHLKDGVFSSWYMQETYPCCVVGEFEDGGSTYASPVGILTLEGEYIPWSEGLWEEKETELQAFSDWQNWGGLSTLPDGTYYRWPDGSPATEWFDWCGRIGPDGRGFVQKNGKIYRIEFTSQKT